MTARGQAVALCAPGAAEATALLRQAFADDGPVYVYAASPGAITPLEERPAADLAVDAAWPAGRAFSAAREVRWEVAEDGGVALLLLQEAGDDGQGLPAGWEAGAVEDFEALQPSASPQHGVYLLGVRLGDEAVWRTARVPRALRYPSPSARARLRYLHYRDAGRAVRYTRLTGVV